MGPTGIYDTSPCSKAAGLASEARRRARGGSIVSTRAGLAEIRAWLDRFSTVALDAYAAEVESGSQESHERRPTMVRPAPVSK